jgi:hypothetical protein
MTVPQKPKFPDSPGKDSTTACPELKSLPKNVQLSDVSKTIIDNYTIYYQCAVKVDAWIEWYETQKKIFESVK